LHISFLCRTSRPPLPYLIAGKCAPEKGKPQELLLADISIDVAAHISERLRNFRQDGGQIELLLERPQDLLLSLCTADITHEIGYNV
jgi:hypothetical protein